MLTFIENSISSSFFIYIYNSILFLGYLDGINNMKEAEPLQDLGGQFVDTLSRIKVKTYRHIKYFGGSLLTSSLGFRSHKILGDPEKGEQTFWRPIALVSSVSYNEVLELTNSRLESILMKYETISIDRTISEKCLYQLLGKCKLLTKGNKKNNFPQKISVSQ